MVIQEQGGAGLFSGSTEIRPLARDDLMWSASLHSAQLPHGFFAQLGVRYLRTYHASFITSPHALGMVAIVEGEPTGFLLATTDSAAHYRHVLRYSGLPLILRGGFALARRPRLLARFVSTRARRYARGARRLRQRPVARILARRPAAEVVHIAVEPGSAGRGVGRSLLVHAEAALAGMGARRVLAKTVDAGGFYAALGWGKRGPSADLEGALHEVFERRLDRPHAAVTGPAGDSPVAAASGTA